MKYNNRNMESFNIQVELGGEFKKANKLKDFKRNEKHVADLLKKNNIHNWVFCEAVLNDLVIINTCANNIEEINNLFINVKSLFKKVSIGVFYHEFGDFDYNEQTFEECLDANLFSK
jgi:hypothetical protein